MTTMMKSRINETLTKTSATINDAMGPRIILPRHQPTVIQQEGWLLKRGAGYKGNPADSFTTKGGGVEEDEDAPSYLTPTTPSRRSSGFRLPTSRGSISAYFVGKDEKKRYFILLTTPAKTSKKLKRKSEAVDNKVVGPKAEIRYYAGRPGSEEERNKPKGSIILTADLEVELDDVTLKIFAPGRTYYLRQDVEEEQMAKAKTQASQWLNAIKFALSGLRAWELNAAAGSVQPHPMQDRQSLRLGLFVIPEAGGASADMRKAQRKSAKTKVGGPLETLPDEEDESITSFAMLWQLQGIEGYDCVVAHFGPGQADLSRMKDHFTARAMQIETEISVLDVELSHAVDVVVKEQKTTSDVMRELHRASVKNSSALKESSKDYKARVIAPIEKSTHELGVKLEAIVQKSSAAAKYVEAARQALGASMDKIEKLQSALSFASSLQGNGSGSPPPATIDSKAKTAISGMRRKSDAPLPDPAKIEHELNDARQTRRDAQQTLVITEAKNAETISRAMIELEELEKSRLILIRDVLMASADIESRLAMKITMEISLVDTAVEVVDAAKDIRMTFAHLKAHAEKNRPTGRVRRKNSLMARSEFLHSVTELEV